MVNLVAAFRTSAVVPAPPSETVNARVILIGLFGSLCAILFGYDLGFIGGTVVLPSFLNDFQIANTSAAYRTAFSSNVVALFQAGAVFGALVSSYGANRIGRRVTLMLNLVLYLIGAAFMTGADGSAGVALMYTGRVLTGWGVGASTMLVPIYVSECAPPHIRGRLTGLYEVGVQCGTMIGFWVPYGVLKTQVGTNQWRIPMAVQIIPAAGSLIGLFFLTETPRYLAKQDRNAEALAVLAKLRGLPQTHEYVAHEHEGMIHAVQMEHELSNGLGRFGVVKETFGRSNWKRLVIGVMIMINFQMAGTNAVNYYSPLIFQSLGLSGDSSKLFATGIYGIVRFVATLIAMVFFTDRFGRKSMIVTGGGIMALFMWIVGALIKSYPPQAGSQSGPAAGQIAAIVCIYLWAIAFCFSYAGIPWIYCSEIFPLRIRPLCMAICTAVHWSFNLMLAKTTPLMIANLGGYGIYFVFAVCTTIGAIWQALYMPETKGRTLEEIEEAFGGKRTAVRDTAGRKNSVVEDQEDEERKRDELRVESV